ncbi:MAG TPA: PAS domain S-box protein [Methanoregula sp.]|nr:PAS domain S-box protein [Methanoregula sp.]
MISVLYVDDEPTLLEVCKIFLERKGEFAVDTETSALKAIESLKHRHYDVVVSDYQMPELDGIGFLKRFRLEHPTLPFLIFTGKGREEIAVAAYENGADFYIQKGGNPVAQFAELSHKIRKAFEQRAAERALAESETRFRALIQNTSDIIRILGHDGRIVYDSPAASRILGFPEQFFIGKDPLDFIHPEDSGRVTADLGRVRDLTNPGTPTEFRIRRADGEYVEVESVALNLFGTPGIDGIVVTTRVIAERKRAERVFRESEERLRDLYDNAPNAYYSVDTCGCITRCNRQACAILGTSCEEITGKKISEVFAVGDGLDCKARQILDGIGRGGTTRGELQVRRAGQSPIWINFTVNAIRDVSGAVTGSRVIATDITDRKALEEELRKKNEDLGASFEELTAVEEELRQNTENLVASQLLLQAGEANYRTLAENIPGIVYRLPAQEGSPAQFFNPTLTHLTGYRPEELEPGTLSPLVSIMLPEDRERAIRTVEAGIRTGKPFVAEYRIRAKDGSVRYFIERGRPVSGADGWFAGIDGIIDDETDRKQAEGDLAESRRAFDTLIANLPGMVYRCRNDPDWTMEFVSGGCRELTGYDPAELVGNRAVAYGSLVFPEDRDAVWEQVQDAVVNRGPFQMAYRIRDRAGLTRWVWEQGRGIFDDTGNFRVLEGYVADISGHRHAEDALRMTNRKLQLLSGITRHDIQNQLTTLRGALALVGHEHLDPESKKLIETAEKAAGTIGSQIEFTKEYENLGVKEPRWQDIAGVFRSAARHFLMCDVMLELPAEGYEIYADPLLEKVFYNLIDNAFRHGGDISRISLSVTQTGGKLVITVEDDGQGVPDADKPLIFDQDFGRNTGLGLFLSRDILLITGISIAENGKYGEGARFVITVPEGAFRPLAVKQNS